MLLSVLLAEYISANPRITSIETGRRYHTMLANFERYLNRDATVADLDQNTYGRWISSRRESRRVSAGTIRGEAEKLLVLWRYAADEGHAKRPRVVLPPSQSTEPVAWFPEEVARLEKAARECTWRVGGIRGNVYWPALVGLAIDTGERINAIHQLHAADIDLANGCVRFRRETRKGGRRSSTKLLDAQTVRHLAELLQERPDQPFAPVLVGSLYPAFRRLLADAGLPRERCRMFHCLRRTHATAVHVQGGDASASLGHSDSRVTRDSYLDPRQIAQVIPQRLQPRRSLLGALRNPLGWFKSAG